jgi:hypothetical protein
VIPLSENAELLLLTRKAAQRSRATEKTSGRAGNAAVSTNNAHDTSAERAVGALQATDGARHTVDPAALAADRACNIDDTFDISAASLCNAADRACTIDDAAHNSAASLCNASDRSGPSIVAACKTLAATAHRDDQTAHETDSAIHPAASTCFDAEVATHASVSTFCEVMEKSHPGDVQFPRRHHVQRAGRHLAAQQAQDRGPARQRELTAGPR